MASSTFVQLTCSVLFHSIVLKTKAVVRERDDRSALSRAGQRQKSPTHIVAHDQWCSALALVCFGFRRSS